jgi:hypothetical protein
LPHIPPGPPKQNRAIEFAPDSPLEESGFEPLVPLNLRVLGEYDGIRDQRTTRDFA